eukprot:4260997-Pleurochrysis_carterae.AAC.1
MEGSQIQVQDSDLPAVNRYFSEREVPQRAHGDEELELGHHRARLSAQGDEFLLTFVEVCKQKLFKTGLEGGIHAMCHDPHKSSFQGLERGHLLARFLHATRNYLLDQAVYGEMSKLLDGSCGSAVQVVDDFDNSHLLGYLHGLHLFLFLLFHATALLTSGNDGGGHLDDALIRRLRGGHDVVPPVFVRV